MTGADAEASAGVGGAAMMTCIDSMKLDTGFGNPTKLHGTLAEV